MKGYLKKYLKEFVNNQLLFCKIFLIVAISFCPFILTAQVTLSALLEIVNDKYSSKNILKLENELIIEENVRENNIVPTIGLDLGQQANFGRTFDPVSGTITPRDSWYNSSNIGLKIQYNLSNVFEKRINNEITKVTTVSNELTFRKKNIIENIDIINLFFDILLLKNKLELEAQYEDTFYPISNVINSLNKSGKVDTITILDMVSEIEMNSINISHFLTKYFDSIRELKNLVGMPLSSDLLLHNSSDKDFTRIDSFDILIEKDLEIQKIWQDYRVDSLNLHKEALNRIPKIDIFSTFGSYYSSVLKQQYSIIDQLNLNSFINLGIRVNIPVLDISKKSERRQIQIRSKILEHQSILKEKQLSRFYRGLFDQYNYDLHMYNKLKDQLEVRENISRLNFVKFQYSKISFQQFIESNKKLKNFNIELCTLKFSIMKQREIIKHLLSHSEM